MKVNRQAKYIYRIFKKHPWRTFIMVAIPNLLYFFMLCFIALPTREFLEVNWLPGQRAKAYVTKAIPTFYHGRNGRRSGLYTLLYSPAPKPCLLMKSLPETQTYITEGRNTSRSCNPLGIKTHEKLHKSVNRQCWCFEVTVLVI